MSACECCGASGATPSPWEENLCPPCTARMAVSIAASDHLRHVLRLALDTWADAWQAHPHVLKGVNEEVRFIASEVITEISTERVPARRNLKLKKTA